MKIGEYEQMMSWLTRPEAPTPIEPREKLFWWIIKIK